MEYTDKIDANIATLAGIICEELTFSHQVEGENFFEFKMEVKRLSESKDYIPVTISEKVLLGKKLKVGDFVRVEGEYRSYNKLLSEKSRLMLHLFAKDLMIDENKEYINEVKLTGFLCKEPIYRKTPFNREICDILLAVNRLNYHKSDYVPCILWGRNARFIAGQNVGCKMEIVGRIQSREYSKSHEDGSVETKTAYEVSCQRISILGNIASFKKESGSSEEVVGD